MLPRKGDDASSVIIRESCLLPVRSPGSFHTRWKYAEIRDGPVAHAHRHQNSSAQKRKPAVIEYVSIKIIDVDSGGTRAHEPVQRFLEERGCRANNHLVGEVSPYRAFSALRVVRLSNPGEE